MKIGEKIVRKERSGKVGPIGGHKADEYTEKYESVTVGISTARDILKGKSCSSNAEATIRTTQLILNDMSKSKAKKEVSDLLDDAIRACHKQK